MTTSTKRHVLVVDDEEGIRELLVEFMTRSGYRVTAVESPEDAQCVVQQDPPDLVISDLQLESSDGLEMIRKLRSGSPDIPMMLLTGVGFSPAVIRDMLSRKIVSSYVQKTCPWGEIVGEVQRLIGAC
jgi:DNA-binding NtrC family response regulator